jgi:hypothetical protein
MSASVRSFAAVARYVAAAIVLFAAGCTEIDGQRVTWRYDAEGDALWILLHYDGIHGKDDGEREKTLEQIATFAANGDLLLREWPFHLEMAKIREAAADESAPAPLRAFAQTLSSSWTSVPVGHYRDGGRRIGALQCVRVAHFRDVVARGNALLNANIVAGDPDREWRLTAARMLPGAREGKPWIFVQGHAFGIEFPAHPREWAERKAEFFRDIIHEGEKRDGHVGKNFAQLLAQGPVLLSESPAGVRVRVGDPERPVTLRFRVNDEPGVDVDEAVKKAAPADLDALLADHLLGRGAADAPAAIAALAEWGPPEDRVRALLNRAAAAEGEDLAAVLAKLTEFAESWNRTEGLPEAPAGAGTREERLLAWWKWYQTMLEFPR